MEEGAPSVDPGFSDSLRHELALGDLSLASTRPVLRHLLGGGDGTLSDQIVARIRGMIHDCARQLVDTLTDAGDAPADGVEEAASLLQAEDGLVAHLHAIAWEAQLAERIATRSGIDPVLSPLLQTFAASPEEDRAAAAMQVLSAQARFVQRARRMACPLTELPPDLFHRAVRALDEIASEFDIAETAAAALRAAYDERHTRQGRFAHLMSTLGPESAQALEVDFAGLSLFASALAHHLGEDRDTVLLTFAERQYARLALTLRAAGLSGGALQAQFFYLHPDIAVPEPLVALPSGEARALLDGATA